MGAYKSSTTINDFIEMFNKKRGDCPQINIYIHWEYKKNSQQDTVLMNRYKKSN